MKSSCPNGPTCPTCVMGGYAALTGTPQGTGFMVPDGLMTSGVMIVAEALGEAEAEQLKALVGSSGFLMGRAFSRKGWGRDEFRHANILFCHPVDNEIRDGRGRLYPWAEQAIQTCAPNVDGEIDRWRPRAIVALGQTAFTALTGVDLPISAARGYAFRDAKDRTWVVPTYHPAFLLRGQNALTQVFLWDVGKARRIAAEGYAYQRPECLMFPPLPVWQEYVREFKQDPTRMLAGDIETPYKAKHKDDEDEADLTEEDDPTYTINCVSFAFEEDRGITVPGTPAYMEGVREILLAARQTCFWNRPYDRPRLMRALDIDLPLTTCMDAMDQWHVCFNALPRKLGFATSCLPGGYYLQAWKHLSSSDPGYYSVVDSVALWRNWRDCQQILAQTGAETTYDLFCRRLDPPLEHMHLAGMPVDRERRTALRATLMGQMETLRAEMDALVPEEVKSPKVWVTEANAIKGKATFVEKLRREGDPLLKLVEGAEIFAIPTMKDEMTCVQCGAWPVTKGKHTGRKTVEVGR